MLALFMFKSKMLLMSGVEPEKPNDDLVPQLRRNAAIILRINSSIASQTAEREAILQSLKARIREEGVPKEARFEVTALLDGAERNLDSETTANAIRILEKLDKELSDSSGETITWLDVENQIVSHRDPGPSETKDMYFFNIGILPTEAGLQESYSSSFKVPIDRAVRLQLWNPLDEELSWDMELSDILDRGISAPEWVFEPEIFVSGSGRLVGLSGAKSVDIPWPAIGNAAVEEMFDKHGLEQIPKVASAITMLTENKKDQST